MAFLPQYVQEETVRVSGFVRSDRKTKHLIPRLSAGEIAVVAHENLDEIAAKGLLAARVKAVVNISCSMTGRYPNQGPMLLLHAGIPLFDIQTAEFSKELSGLMDMIHDGDFITILDHSMYLGDRYIGRVKQITAEEIIGKLGDAKLNFPAELSRFLENTLQYANQEKEFFLGDLSVPDLKTIIRGRHALVVVRGSSYVDDLQAIFHYIKEQKPVLIGVDGGADALLQMGLRPDIIAGDMDSVSDDALRSGAELIVHAYTDGKAPGLIRLQRLGLDAHVYPAPGTSEDIAMLIMLELGAELIVAVGTHTHMIDFLEKGRKGMASTLLSRLRVGSKLVDAKGVSQLYQTRVSWLSAGIVMVATLIPITMLAAVNPVIRNILRVLYWKLKILFA